MIRAFLSGGRQCLSGIKLVNSKITQSPSLFNKNLTKCFSSLNQPILPNRCSLTLPIQSGPLLIPKTLPNAITQSRTYLKFSRGKGKKKTDRSVVKRFYRLNWGIWIRRIAGCHKKYWAKSPQRKRRLLQHVMVNANQATRLDKMVHKCWLKPKYYIEDPYEPYHSREEFRMTRRKPRELPY